MIRPGRTLILLAGLLGFPGAAPELRAETLRSPLSTRELLLPFLVFLSPVPEEADLLGMGAGEVSLSLSHSNTFVGTSVFRRMEDLPPEARTLVDRDSVNAYLASHPGNDLFFLDGEVLRTDLHLEFGLHRNLDIGVSVPFLRYTGGIMDGFIEDFHDSLGFPDDGRANFARDAFQMVLSLGDSDLLVTGSPAGFGLGDISVFGKVPLHRNPAGKRTLSAAARLKLPTGSEGKLLGSGSLDYGAQILFTERRPRQALHFSLETVRLGTWDLLPELRLSDVYSVSGSYEVLVGGGTALVGQLTFSTSPFREVTREDLGQPSLQLTTGFRRRFPAGWALEGALMENPFRTNSSADFGTHFGVSYDFGASPPSPFRAPRNRSVPPPKFQ